MSVSQQASDHEPTAGHVGQASSADAPERAPSAAVDLQTAQQPDRAVHAVDGEEPPRLPFPVVGIGGSAGGLEAFSDFLKAVPADSGMAFVVIQHLPPERESMVSDILSRQTSMSVSQVEDGLRVEANHVYVIRPGRTLTIKDRALHFGAEVDRPTNRRPVDDFFRSLAEEQRHRAICIIMSGMGSNGTAGAQAIKAVGGVCIAQDPESAKYPSMPRSLIDSGLADFVLRPDQMPEVLLKYARHPYAIGADAADPALAQDRQAFAEILSIIRARTQQDFSGYKRPTVLRRIQRRMGLSQVTRLGDYTKLLRQNPSEVSALADDLVIHVTGFFRDTNAWEILRQKVILPLVEKREPESAVRAWVTACSSGEEAYTLAILLTEAAESVGKALDIKVFATDVTDRTLAHARNGIYAGGIESELSPERLERFFTKEDSSYRVNKELRERVVFAPQDILHDPPFSRLDICTCRNLLIYLEPELQKHVLSLLHFGLREGGVLFLGSSETTAGAEDFFEPVDKKHRIFRRTGPARQPRLDTPGSLYRVPPGVGEEPSGARPLARASLAQLTQQVLLESFTPPSVVVDRQFEVVLFHGDTGPYLLQPPGEPTRELLPMARESVRGALRIALHNAATDGQPSIVRDGFIEDMSGRRRVAVNVAPLWPRVSPGYFLVSFQSWPEALPAAGPRGVGEQGPEDVNEVVAELNRVRDELQSAVEELQTSNEELKSSNEEVTSVNEELQSTNEELETSKEELQSLNEELTTVNAQLQAKMEELESATSDLSSLLSSTDIGVVFLDRNFCIRRFTPATRNLIDLIASDVGRPLRDMACKFTDPELMSDAQAVLDRLIPREREIVSNSGQWYVRRVLPYRTMDNRIEGVVITFVDVTRTHQAEAARRESEESYRLIIQGVREYAIVMLDEEGRFATWNVGAAKVLGYPDAGVIGRHLGLIYTPEARAAAEPEAALHRATQTGEAAGDGWYLRVDGTRIWGTGVLTALQDDQGRTRGYALVMRDNTDRKVAEEHLLAATHAAEAANEAKDQFLATISHELRTPLSAILLWSHILQSAPNDPAQLKEGIETITQCAEAQRQLIEDLLDTTRISSGKMRLNLVELDPADAVRSAVETIRTTAQAKDVRLFESYAKDVGHILADPDRLRQIAWNLLSNAVKFTPGGGSVNVKVVRSGDLIELAVKDTGIGIDPEFLPRIFARFVQAEEVQHRRYSGLGLGLTIVKQLTELLGGTVTASSEGPDKGAAFVVRIPALNSHHKSRDRRFANRRHALAPEALKGVHVLLVEDDANTNAAFAATLRRSKAHVAAFTSARQALAAFSEKKPDIILSDIGMPEMDGYAFIREVRELEAAEQRSPVPAIAVSAFTTEDDRNRAVSSGFQAHISKPVDPTQLLAAMLDVLRPA